MKCERTTSSDLIIYTNFGELQSLLTQALIAPLSVRITNTWTLRESIQQYPECFLRLVLSEEPLENGYSWSFDPESTNFGDIKWFEVQIDQEELQKISNMDLWTVRMQPWSSQITIVCRNCLEH